MILSREQILAAADIQTEAVEVPEWGGSVLVRALSGYERDKFETSNYTRTMKGAKFEIEPNTLNIRARLAAMCIVDESGRRLFTATDVEALGNKNAAALNRVFEVSQRLSGLTPADIEELEGNSEAAPSGETTSA